MHCFKVGKEYGRAIDVYHSRDATVVHLLKRSDVAVVTIHLEAHGILGMHPATADQLFFVVAGSGQAITAEERCHLSPGTAVLWQRAEEHETRACAQGLTAVVVEGDDLSESLAPHLMA